MVEKEFFRKCLFKDRICSLILTMFMLAVAAAVCMPMGEVAAATNYNFNAEASSAQLADKPGVYYVKPTISSGKTIGIKSISKDNLTNNATDEMPAIIMGAAVNYEIKTGPTTFKPISGKNLVAPYSYFRWKTIQETVQDADGKQTTHTKLSGFDGSYYIIRIDMSEIINGKDTGNYVLHVRQEDNKALMTATGATKTADVETFCYTDATTQKIYKVGSYKLKDAASAMKDKNGSTPYFDVVVLSSSKLVAGAQGSDQPNAGDIGLQFYIDEVFDYDPDLVIPDPLPTVSPTNPVAGYTDEGKYLSALGRKYFRDDNYKNAATKADYTVKGSDHEIDVGIDENEFKDSDKEIGAKKDGIDWMKEKMKFWSMTKAVEHKGFNNHTITMICEVPVLEGLDVSGGNDRAVILDVNSFDVQVANDKEKGTAGITVGNGSQLRIMDSTKTAGAELAIGNNALMVIKKGGILIIDESCTGEVEYDAATVTDPAQLDKTMMNGSITVEDGGKLVNHGVLNIEGVEAKPLDPAAQTQQITDMKTADIAIHYNGIVDNYGCISLKGVLYVLGTLNNYGKYNDTIVAGDPDKGTREYHRGIQLTWKDVVNDKNRPVTPGILNIGIDKDGKIESRALVDNHGDIVMVPGIINLYGTLRNNGSDAHVYMCTVDEAVIPVINPNDPLEVERRVKIDPPKQSVFNNHGTLIGFLESAKVEVISNGVLGKLTPLGNFGEEPKQENKSEPLPPTILNTTSTSSKSESSSPKMESYGSKGSKGYYEKTGKNTVEYDGPAVSKDAKAITVPDTVKIGKKTYKVTTIKSYSFTGYDKVESVTVGKNIDTIEPDAFNGCEKLTTLKIKSKNLTKKSIKNCLRGSKVKTIIISKSAKKKYALYKKIFTKKITGASVKLTIKLEK